MRTVMLCCRVDRVARAFKRLKGVRRDVHQIAHFVGVHGISDDLCLADFRALCRENQVISSRFRPPPPNKNARNENVLLRSAVEQLWNLYNAKRHTNDAMRQCHNV